MAAGNRPAPNELFSIIVFYGCAHRAEEAEEADVKTESL